MRVVCKYCNKKFASDAKLAFHNTYFCGPNARMTAGQAKMGRKNHGSRNTGGSSKKEQKKSAKKGKKKKVVSSSESEWEPSDEDDDEDDDDEDGWDDDGGAFERLQALARSDARSVFDEARRLGLLEVLQGMPASERKYCAKVPLAELSTWVDRLHRNATLRAARTVR